VFSIFADKHKCWKKREDERRYKPRYIDTIPWEMWAVPTLIGA
jgi:hypothetical protein